MEINIDKSRKIFHVTVEGLPTKESTQRVLENYNYNAQGINRGDYSLLIDCSKLRIFQQESITMLEQLFKLYMDSGFKNIVFVKSKKHIQNMQLARVVKEVPGFYGIFVDDIAEALAACAG